VELLRGSRHPVGRELRALIERDADIALTEVILMELLAGARSGPPVRELRSRLLAFRLIPLEGLVDFEEAALIYRACRDAGETVRSLSDCLIAAPVIRAGASLLHNDGDFETIARHSRLKVHAILSR
jgi:predicted nucleic acid-binding protein